MRKIVFGAVLMSVMSLAFAKGEEIPDDTLLVKLPATARLIVTGYLKNGLSMCGYPSDFGVGDNNGDDPFIYACQSPFIKLNKGDVALINSVEKKFANFDTYYFYMTTKDGVSIPLYLERYKSSTVKGLKLLLSGKLSLVYDDPYAGMSKDMVVDLSMAKITTKLKASDYSGAISDFVKLESLEGTVLPESFYYYYTDTLLKTGDKAKAQTYAAEYLKQYGKKSKYYAQVIEIMSHL